MQGTGRQAAILSRNRLFSPSPSASAGPSPAYTRYSLRGMTDRLLANNNAPTPAIPQHFKARGQRSGLGAGEGSKALRQALVQLSFKGHVFPPLM
ncbi:unnamed protein product [Coccothraustes coccothraustes]